MLKSTITRREYQAVYRLLDRVSPVDFDCGTVCGAACCGEADEEDLGIYLLPGEDKMHRRDASWISWSSQDASDFEFPDSWNGKVYFIHCKTPPVCPREQRPIQCRTFPLAPHLTAGGELHLIWNDQELPYCCPLLEEETELEDRFLRATCTAWKHLVRDPLIRDLVEMDSKARRDAAEDGSDPEFLI